MNRKKIFALAASVAIILLMTTSALSLVHSPQGMPKVDELFFKAYPGATADTVVEEFLTGVTEIIGGPARRDLYDSVVDAGHTISTMDPMAEFGALAINCREFKVTSLESNFPLNDASFRVALSYIYGMDEKQEDIFNYIQAPWLFALGNPIPPAQEPWYDESIVMPDTDWDVAWDILQADGYEVVGGHLSKGGVALRDLEVLYTAGSLYAEQGPVNGFATNFNEFITYIGATAPTMTITPVEFTTWVMELLTYRDYDFVSFGFTNLGVYADWISPWIHRRGLVDWGWNVAGIEDDEFDTWADIIITSLDVDEVVQAYSDITAKFIYELMPWFPIDAGLDFCTTWSSEERGTLTNIISMPNYGPRQDWTWRGMHWMGEEYGGSVMVAIGDEPHTMNPFTEDTLYGWRLIGRAVDSLIEREPVGLNLRPSVACDWFVDVWTSIPELGITEGSTATFWLRQDVTWQDGVPLTAYDCVNNMRLLREHEPGRYATVWENLVYEEADGPYKFNVYFATTNLATVDDVSGTALLAPKHIMDLVDEQVELGTLLLWEDWDPAFNSYADLTGELPPEEYPFMTQHVGTGAYVFDYYDRSLATGRVVKYEDYWAKAGTLGAVVGEWRVDPDTAYPYKVLVHNYQAKSVTETSSEVVSVTVDVNVYEDGVLAHEETGITLDPYEALYLGPYTTGALAGGAHTITVEIYEDGTLVHTYEHKMVATIREDINTYTGTVLDFRCNILDITRAAAAFGSYPGHLRWDPPADINDSYRVDILDVAGIARNFGWVA